MIMINSIQMSEVLKTLNNWGFVDSFSVGGFEYMGFSEKKPNKLIIISSQKETVYDCDNKSLTEAGIDIDEKEYTAMCDLFPDEIIHIASYWGGSLPHSTPQGDQVEISYYGDHVTSMGKELRLQKIYFVDGTGNKTLIYDDYPCYVCGFSHDGKYFALADDGGLTVIRRK